MYKDLLIVSTIALLMIGCKQPSANEDNWVPPAVEGGGNFWDNAVEDGKIDLGGRNSVNFSVTSSLDQSSAFPITLNSGLTFYDLAPEAGLEMSSEGLITSMLGVHGADIVLSVRVFGAFNQEGSGKVTVYTKDGKSKAVVNVTVK